MPRIEKYIYLRICVCGNIYTYIYVCEINRMCVKERVGAIYVDTDAFICMIIYLLMCQR